MDSFLAHGDRDVMFNFLKPLNTSKLKQTFIVHGDYEEAQIPFKNFLEKNNFRNISTYKDNSWKCNWCNLLNINNIHKC